MSRYIEQIIGIVVGCRTAGGRSSAAPVSSAAPKKKHLIKAALFGRLDQMLWMAVQGGVWTGKAVVWTVVYIFNHFENLIKAINQINNSPKRQ